MFLDPGNCSFMILGVDDGLQTYVVCGSETLKQKTRKSIRWYYWQKTQICNAFCKHDQKFWVQKYINTE